jgi:hypothetical protein
MDRIRKARNVAMNGGVALNQGPELEFGKRIDHTLGGVDVPKVALKGLVSDATSPLTEGNVKTEE